MKLILLKSSAFSVLKIWSVPKVIFIFQQKKKANKKKKKAAKKSKYTLIYYCI